MDEKSTFRSQFKVFRESKQAVLAQPQHHLKKSLSVFSDTVLGLVLECDTYISSWVRQCFSGQKHLKDSRRECTGGAERLLSHGVKLKDPTFIYHLFFIHYFSGRILFCQNPQQRLSSLICLPKYLQDRRWGPLCLAHNIRNKQLLLLSFQTAQSSSGHDIPILISSVTKKVSPKDRLVLCLRYHKFHQWRKPSTHKIASQIYILMARETCPSGGVPLKIVAKCKFSLPQQT